MKTSIIGLLALWLTLIMMAAPPNAAYRVKCLYLIQLSAFRTSLDSLQVSNKTGDDLYKLQDCFYTCRMAWKQIEPLVAYVEPYYFQQINAPDVVRIEIDRKGQVTRHEAKGLQVIERLLFSSSSFSPNTRISLQQEIVDLSNICGILTARATQGTFTDALIWAALKQNLLRLSSLGLVGFDTPLAQLTTSEMRASCTATHRYWEAYAADLTSVHPSLHRDILNLFAQTDSILGVAEKSKSIDQLYILRTLFRPLYAAFTDAQVALRIVPVDATYPHRHTIVQSERDLWTHRLFRSAAFSIQPHADLSNKDLVTLGKRLFFSPLLSATGKRSCGSCHQPDFAYASPLVSDTAIDGRTLLLRNTPTLSQVALQRRFLWDGSVRDLSAQFHKVLFNPQEMGGIESVLVKRLAEDTTFMHLFGQAFGRDNMIGGPRLRHIQIALEGFLHTLNRFESEFDRYVSGEMQTIDSNVYAGFNVFMGKGRCGTCHFAPLFNGTRPPDFLENEMEVIGVPNRLDENPIKIDEDLGLFATTGQVEHRFAFRTPTLRNVALTAPYMHNGIYATLEEVIHFYDAGGGSGLGLALTHQTLSDKPLQLTVAEKLHLQAFLTSLNNKKGLE